MKGEIFVIGAGKLGAKIASLLYDEGHNVVVIDKSDSAFHKLDDFSGFTVNGDATDLDFLKSQDIEDAEMVIITTDSDNTNLFLADVCFYLFDIKKIYVRLSDTDKGLLLENTPIVGIYPFNLSVDFFCSKEKEGKKQ
jgi:trk system potassium uptake protein TrkA